MRDYYGQVDYSGDKTFSREVFAGQKIGEGNSKKGKKEGRTKRDQYGSHNAGLNFIVLAGLKEFRKT